VRGASRVEVLVVLAALAVGCKTSPTTPESHRASDVPCPLGAPVSTAPCDASAQCPALANVACLAYDDAGIARYCNADACHTDVDCADAGVCLCGSPATSTAIATPNACLSGGNCRVDSDCTQSHYCSPSSVGCGMTFSYFCHTPSDDCANDTDCRSEQFCQYAPGSGGTGKWTCVNAGACGGY
jgi:hypothetical protein